MFNFHKDHKMLVITSFGVYLALSLFVSVIPAENIDDAQPLPAAEPLSEMEQKGLRVYVSQNCMACHTQQVRNIEMDKVWGERPSIPSDYYYDKQRLSLWVQTPSVLGSERTGPDLTNIGKRNPSKQWQLLHLYNPRSVVSASIMPSYVWLFKAKDTSSITEEDVVVPVPEDFFNVPGKKVVAKPEALQLVAYLLSLKQAPMPDGTQDVEFIPFSTELEGEGVANNGNSGSSGGTGGSGLNGEALFIQHCSVCHQKNGQGLPGAFPPLAGSPIVNDEDPTMMIQIILQGYDARKEYAVMTPFGDILSNEEIAAIATHERSSWGNNASPVTPEEVQKVREFIKSQKSTK